MGYQYRQFSLVHRGVENHEFKRSVAFIKSGNSLFMKQERNIFWKFNPEKIKNVLKLQKKLKHRLTQ